MITTLDKIEYRQDESLSRYCTFRVGGEADLVIFPKDRDELITSIAYCKSSKINYILIGNGSNILFPDEGFRGAVIKIGRNMSDVHCDGEYIYASAGATLFQVARAAADHSLTGMEFAAGIPGTVGGAVCMNAGAYGGEIKDVAVSVDILDVSTIKDTASGCTAGDARSQNECPSVRKIAVSDMDFGYRHSILSDNSNLIVLGAMFKLTKGDREAIENRMKELANARVSKQPLEYPSAGSTFKRPEGYFAGKLIEDSGLKGYRVGGACVSEKHCGFVVNDNHATAADIKKVISDVQATVYEKFHVRLETEVKII
jgi:UDP-N-acetylmuramate dehydrogenase